MTVLAIATLVSWLVVLASLAGGGGTSKGVHIAAAPVLSIALAIAVLV